MTTSQKSARPLHPPLADTVPADYVIPERLVAIHARMDDLFSGPAFPDLIDLAMATAISQRVVAHGPPLWLLFEGAPSTGKTAVANLLKGVGVPGKPDNRIAVFAPAITKGSLTGGFKDGKGRRAPALLIELDKRCWVNTDFGTLLTGRSESVLPILGALTSAFDGEFAAAFGNVSESSSAILEHKSRFSILGCITPQVRQQHSTLLQNLGPRFVSYRLLPLTADEKHRALRLLRDPAGRDAQIKALEKEVIAHVRVVLKSLAPVVVPEETEAVLESLSRIVAEGRTPVTGVVGALLVGLPEDTPRVYRQLHTLAVSLAHIHGTTTPSPRALRIVRDVALSSLEPQRAEALVVQRTSPVLAARLSNSPPVFFHGLIPSHLAAETGWSQDMAGRVLAELEVLGLYVRADRDLVMIRKSQPGPPPVLYIPAPGLEWVLNATFEGYPPHLITHADMFAGRATIESLSPPDARLAAAVVTRRTECKHQLEVILTRLIAERPELDPEQLPLLAIEEAIGGPLTSSDTGSPSRGDADEAPHQATADRYGWPD